MDKLDKLTEIFVNWQVILLSFVVFILVGLLRSVGTKKDKDGNAVGGFAENTWFKRFLPAYPYFFSIGLVFIPGLPWPEAVARTMAMKILYGIYAGWLTDKVYQVVKHYLDERGIHLDDLAVKAVTILPAPAPPTDKVDPTPKEPTP